MVERLETESQPLSRFESAVPASLEKVSFLTKNGRTRVPGNQILRYNKSFLTRRVADPEPGSGAFLTPGSGIRDG
jgi:hypothetical protein